MGEIGCFLSHYLIWEEVRLTVFYFLQIWNNFIQSTSELQNGLGRAKQSKPIRSDPIRSELSRTGDFFHIMTSSMPTYSFSFQMINNGLNKVLILEDDVRFQPSFRYNLEELVKEADRLSHKYQWDLM